MSPFMLAALIVLAISWSRAMRRRRGPSPMLIVFTVLFAMMTLSSQAWMFPLFVAMGVMLLIARGSGRARYVRLDKRGRRKVRVRASDPVTPEPQAAPQALPATSGGFHDDLRQFMRDIDQLGREVRGETRVPVGRGETEDARPRVDLRKGRAQRSQERTPDAPPEFVATDELTASVDAVLREHRRVLPPEAVTRIETLRGRVQDAAAYLRERDLLGGEYGFHLRQIATDYLPAAVQAYLRLPRGLADTAPLAEDRSGKDLLIEQLDLLQEGTTSVLTGALRAEGQQLLAHGRFLEKRFDPASKDFDV